MAREPWRAPPRATLARPWPDPVAAGGLEVTVAASRFAAAAKLDRIRALDARVELVDGDFPSRPSWPIAIVCGSTST